MNDTVTRARVSLARNVDVVQARQSAVRLAHARNFGRSDQARVDLIVAELATNVVRHAGRGEIVVMDADEVTASLSIVCTDSGPGITPGQRDGSSGLGLGLAVVRELADAVEIKSTEQGTWVRATVTQRSK